MADGVEPTEQDLEIARQGVMLQYENNPIEDFLENQIRVIASERAYSRMLQNILHKRDGLIAEE